MAVVYIGFGSNLGNREKNCHQALGFLNATNGITITNTSPFYETVAVTLPGETLPDFINGACRLETTLTPEKLHQALKEIEEKVGRKPVDRLWQSRIIDLDILFYDDLIVKTEKLKIPHPLLQERFFVLKPLHDIAPEFIHPIQKFSIKQLLSEMGKPAGCVKKN